MEYQPNSNWLDDFWDTSEELLQDVILLEAMALRLEQEKSCLVRTSPELMEDTCVRLLNYLSQHAGELSSLQQRLRNT